LSAARERARERDAMDDAVQRLADQYPEEFCDFPNRWQRIKDFENDKIEIA
jgi:hypothetical protein